MGAMAENMEKEMEYQQTRPSCLGTGLRGLA